MARSIGCNDMPQTPDLVVNRNFTPLNRPKGSWIIEMGCGKAVGQGIGGI